jgi:pimeloyl-ACP methyl ester carboxylesterase
VPRFEPAACPAPGPAEASCGYLVVPERRDEAGSRAIRLAVAILPARGQEPAPDPVVFLTGGPGASAVEPLKAWSKNPLRERRTVILFEQRGTQHAEPWLDCPEVEEVLVANMALALDGGEEVEREVQAAMACRDRLLAQGVDLSAYHSAASAADLEDLRRLLGYEAWNLYGVSYGTRLALTALRDHPDGIRSLVLNSPFPPVADTYVELVDNAESAFHALFADCEADPDCNAAYPNLEQNFYQGLEQVNVDPIAVSIHVPPHEVRLTAKDLVAGMFSSLGSAETNSLLPYVVSRIYEGDQDVLVPMVESGIPSFEGLSRGMLHSVECYEEAPFNPPEAIEAASLSRPILLDYLPIHFNLAICDVWPSGQAGPIETEAVHSDVPVLLLAGEYDPYTPPSWARRAAETLERGYVYIFPGTGHGPVGYSRCARQIMLDFVEDPTAAPGGECLAEMEDPDFLIPGELYATPAIYRLNVDLDVAPHPVRLALGGGSLIVLLGEVIALAWGQRRSRSRESRAGARLASGLAVVVAVLYLAFALALVVVIQIVSSTNWLLLAFGLPAGAAPLFWLPRLAAVLTLPLPFLVAVAWWQGYWEQGRRWRYTLVTVAALVLTALLIHWQMLTLP